MRIKIVFLIVISILFFLYMFVRIFTRKEHYSSSDLTSNLYTWTPESSISMTTTKKKNNEEITSKLFVVDMDTNVDSLSLIHI